jgi:hypothetical protein
MPRAMVVWDGLTEYRALLAKMPQDVAGEAGKMIEGKANSVAHDIKAAYPVRTGKLRDKVQVIHQETSGRLKPSATIKNTDRKARWFELGTKARHNSIGANRGSMPPGRVFIPRILKGRRELIQQFKELLMRYGAKQVAGDA